MEANEQKTGRPALAAVTAYIQTEEEALVIGRRPGGRNRAALTRAICGACPADRV